MTHSAPASPAPSSLLPALLGAAVLGLAGFVAVQASRAPQRLRVAEAAAVPDTARAAGEPPAAASHAPRRDAHEQVDMLLSARAPRTPEELEDIRRRLRLATPGTWFDDVLAEHDSVVLHWRPRDAEPLRVWIAPAAGVPNRRLTFDDAVREAFDTWAEAGAPVRVTYVRDSASAEVPVTWVERFTEDDRVGVTHLRGVNGELTSGAIELATHTRSGVALDEQWIRAIALHEVGHLLGLPHSVSDTASVMLPRAALRGLSRGDRATIRVLYMTPVGSLRSSGAPTAR